MELIVTNTAYQMQGVLRHFEYDAAFGDSENDFLLTVSQDVDIDIGSLVYEYGSDVGGIIDSKGFDNTGAVPFVTYGGRTWHGLLEKSVTRPDSGKAYLTLTGDINAAIGTIISRANLGAVFTPSVKAAGVSVSYQVPRYVSAWEALRRLCRAYGKRPYIHKEGGKCVIEAVDAGSYSDGQISDLTTSVAATRMYRPVNHLVILGQGELTARVVYDVYADSNGNISQTQTLFGVDEVAEVYENTSESDNAKLLDDGKKRLADYQEFASVDMTLSTESGYQIGDVITAYSVETGLRATAEVVKKVVTVNADGDALTDYELGEPIIKAYR